MTRRPTRSLHRFAWRISSVLLGLSIVPHTAMAEAGTVKPVLHGRHWVAVAGKPLAASAGAKIFAQGGNAVDAACAMLGAACTMLDTLSWGGETQALIHNPETGEVRGINALGAAPTGATPEFFRGRGMRYPPAYGPLAAVTPGTPGGLMVMLAEFGSMSLAEVLAPSIEMAKGYPMEAAAADALERHKHRLRQWPYSRAVFLPHVGEEREAPHPGELFRQEDLRQTLLKLIETEAAALADGKSRKQAIYSAYDRFYEGDIAREFVRGSQEQGGLHTLEDLANWEVYVEDPVMTAYKGIEVYKLTTWVQGPVLLQMLNMLEDVDLIVLGHNSAQYIHVIYQTMNLAFADRDFYYGDPYFPPVEPIQGLMSKTYAKERFGEVNWERNDPRVEPGDPYPYEGKENPYTDLLEGWSRRRAGFSRSLTQNERTFEEGFVAGTTTIQAADEDGWVVSITPSGGWTPAVIAGRTGVGMSQRMQSFVLDPKLNPFNVLEPGKRPRATLTPSLALKNGKPFLSFAVQGGDTQEQNQLQFFLNIVEFGLTVQEAAEGPNFNSYQMRSSFDDHASEPGRLTVHTTTQPWVVRKLRDMGYSVRVRDHTSGPINAIWFDQDTGTMWGASSDFGEDYGIAW